MISNQVSLWNGQTWTSDWSSDELSGKIICGTGHRPKLCPCGYNEDHAWFLELDQRLDRLLTHISPKAVIAGCALGFDTWLAETALNLGIPLHSYVPFKGQGENWPKKSQKRLEKLLDRSEVVRYTAESYEKSCFLKRDREMVDNSEAVVALWNPEAMSGGTYYTIQYARKNSLPIINVWK